MFFLKKIRKKCELFKKKHYFCKRNLLIMSNLGYGAYPTHPGEVLKDEIESRGISQRQLADSMGLFVLLAILMHFSQKIEWYK